MGVQCCGTLPLLDAQVAVGLAASLPPPRASSEKEAKQESCQAMGERSELMRRD